ncbi:hypothetical protein ACS0TY_036759 [Phlomoides rotata]
MDDPKTLSKSEHAYYKEIAIQQMNSKTPISGNEETSGIIEAENLAFDKNLVINRSIGMANIQAIRSAQSFVYVENPKMQVLTTCSQWNLH